MLEYLNNIYFGKSFVGRYKFYSFISVFHYSLEQYDNTI